MEISAERAQALLADSRNLANRQPEVTFLRSRNGSRDGLTRNSGREIPPTIRALIGVSAHLDTISSVADAFGVATSTAAQAKKGNVGVNRHDPALAAQIDAALGEHKKSIREEALERLSEMFAGVISGQNLNAMKPREAVSAAKDIATIVDKLTPRDKSPTVAVFVHAPREKDEKEFGEVIVVPSRPSEDVKLT